MSTFPEILYLEVTNRCNSLCATCVRTFDLAEPERDFELANIHALIRAFPAGEAPRRVVLNGVGEALLHRDLVAIVSAFHETRATVHFNTNAVTLTEEIVLALARAGLSELRISIDGATRATYALLRGIDALERVVANVRRAVALLREHRLVAPKLSIWFTGTRQNVTELPEMVRLTHECGLAELYFQRLVFREGDAGFGAAHARHSLVREPLERAEERAFDEAARVAAELGVRLIGAGNALDAREALPSRGAEDRTRPWAPCRRPYSSAYVTANGNVLPCCIAPFSTDDYAAITLGNVRNESLERIWNGESYERFRRRFESDDPVDCCRRCGVDWNL
jgi:radical SAM protein with 4Fe4S-binding SPASM domain